MKIFKTGIALIIAVSIVACGGNANKGAEADSSTEDDAATKKKTLVAGSYTNETLGYTITYPKDVLVLQSETENTDEQVFLHKDSNAKLRIFKDTRKDKGGNILSLNDAFEADKKVSKRQVSYSTLKPLFYVVSGVDNGNEIFYQKTIPAQGTLVTAVLTYTKDEKSVFDPIVPALFGSFK